MCHQNNIKVMLAGRQVSYPVVTRRGMIGRSTRERVTNGVVGLEAGGATAVLG